jgi:hypothetical protein
MPFLKDLSLMQISCKNQIKFSPSENDKNRSAFFCPDEDAVLADKKGILLHLKKASLTVEAAFILPLFFVSVICMAGIMGIYSQTLDRMITLRGYAQTAAAAAGISEEDMWIELPGNVGFTPLYLPGDLKMFNVICSGSVRAWTGRDSNHGSGGYYDEPQYVYVTENGMVYHTSSACTHINLSITKTDIEHAADMRNENGEKYGACEKCGDDAVAKDEIYITRHGNRYHSSLSCSGLKRSVRLVEISKAEGLQECQRCALQKQQ